MSAPERRLTERPEEAELRTVPVGRRAILGGLALGAVGILTGAAVQRGFSRAVAPIADGSALGDVLPTDGRFRIYTVTGTLPARAPAEYRLQVGGTVAQPLDLGFADLDALATTRLSKDFQCVTGWRVRDVAWRGVRVRELLDQAGAGPGAFVRFTSFDGAYWNTLTMEQARRDDVLVATEMLGAPITKAHGGPVRLFVAPMYGYKSCKWLERIDVVDVGPSGYWEERGYDSDAWVGRSNGRTDEPTS